MKWRLNRVYLILYMTNECLLNLLNLGSCNRSIWNIWNTTILITYSCFQFSLWCIDDQFPNALYDWGELGLWQYLWWLGYHSRLPFGAFDVTFSSDKILWIHIPSHFLVREFLFLNFGTASWYYWMFLLCHVTRLHIPTTAGSWSSTYFLNFSQLIPVEISIFLFVDFWKYSRSLGVSFRHIRTCRLPAYILWLGFYKLAYIANCKTDVKSSVSEIYKFSN